MLRNKLFQGIVDAVLHSIAPAHMQQAVDSQSLYICRLGGLTEEDLLKYSRIVGTLLNKTLKVKPSTTHSIAHDEARAMWVVPLPQDERKVQYGKTLSVELVRGLSADQTNFLELWLSIS